MGRRFEKSTAPKAPGKRNAIRRIPLLAGSAFLDSKKSKEKCKKQRPASFCAAARHLSLADAEGRISDGLRACGESSATHRAPRPLQARRPASTSATRLPLHRSHEVHAHVMTPTAFRPSSCASDAAGLCRKALGPLPDDTLPRHRRLQSLTRSPGDLHETCRSGARARAANCAARDSQDPHGAPIGRPHHRRNHPGRPTRARLDRIVTLRSATWAVRVRSFPFDVEMPEPSETIRGVSPTAEWRWLSRRGGGRAVQGLALRSCRMSLKPGRVHLGRVVLWPPWPTRRPLLSACPVGPPTSSPTPVTRTDPAPAVPSR